MTIFKKTVDKDAGRAAMRAIRLGRSPLAAEAPNLSGLLPDVVGDSPNKLMRNRQGLANDVEINALIDLDPPIPNHRVGRFWLLWDDVATGVVKEITSPFIFPITLTLPAEKTVAEGIFTLSYVFEYEGVPYKFAPAVPIYIDKEAPNRGAPGEPMVLPDDVEDDYLSSEYLRANDGVLLTIPLHTDRKTGDIAQVYFGASDPGTLVGSYETPDDSDSDMTVKISLGQFIIEGEGPKIFYYVWRDRVGNTGQHSEPLNVKVILSAAPSNLKPPEVPEAPIDLADAFPDTGVVIQQYDNLDPNDDIRVSWDGIDQPDKKAGSGFPMIVNVPYADIRRGGLGPRPDVKVTYSVWRSGLEYPEGAGIEVAVDLRRPGTPPPDPEPDPDIGNPNLNEVVVRGAVTTDDNKLELVDADGPATASVVVASVRAAKDVYKLYWNNVEVPGAGGSVELDGTEAVDFIVRFTIPIDFIKAQGNGAKVKVHYTISNEDLPGVNPSLRTEVSVYVLAVVLPTPKVAFTSSSGGFDFLTCNSLRTIANIGRAAVVDVPGGTPLAPDMVLNFSWTGNYYDGGGNEVPVTPYEFNKTLSGTEHTEGFSVYIPLAILERITDGSGSIKYSATVDERREDSDPHDVEVVVRDGIGGPCPLV